MSYAPLIRHDGRIKPFAEATVHVSAPALHYGLDSACVRPIAFRGAGRTIDRWRWLTPVYGDALLEAAA